MCDALEEHDGKVSIGGINISTLWFADSIDALFLYACESRTLTAEFEE